MDNHTTSVTPNNSRSTHVNNVGRHAMSEHWKRQDVHASLATLPSPRMEREECRQNRIKVLGTQENWFSHDIVVGTTPTVTSLNAVSGTPDVTSFNPVSGTKSSGTPDVTSFNPVSGTKSSGTPAVTSLNVARGSRDEEDICRQLKRRQLHTDTYGWYRHEHHVINLDDDIDPQYSDSSDEEHKSSLIANGNRCQESGNHGEDNATRCVQHKVARHLNCPSCVVPSPVLPCSRRREDEVMASRMRQESDNWFDYGDNQQFVSPKPRYEHMSAMTIQSPGKTRGQQYSVSSDNSTATSQVPSSTVMSSATSQVPSSTVMSSATSQVPSNAVMSSATSQVSSTVTSSVSPAVHTTSSSTGVKSTIATANRTVADTANQMTPPVTTNHVTLNKISGDQMKLSTTSETLMSSAKKSNNIAKQNMDALLEKFRNAQLNMT